MPLPPPTPKCLLWNHPYPSVSSCVPHKIFFLWALYLIPTPHPPIFLPEYSCYSSVEFLVSLWACICFCGTVIMALCWPQLRDQDWCMSTVTFQSICHSIGGRESAPFSRCLFGFGTAGELPALGVMCSYSLAISGLTTALAQRKKSTWYSHWWRTYGCQQPAWTSPADSVAVQNTSQAKQASRHGLNYILCWYCLPGALEGFQGFVPTSHCCWICLTFSCLFRPSTRWQHFFSTNVFIVHIKLVSS